MNVNEGWNENLLFALGVGEGLKFDDDIGGPMAYIMGVGVEGPGFDSQ